MSLDAPRGRKAGAGPTARSKGPSAALRWFAVLTTFLLFAVVVLGFLDTATNSALGCGRSFPLCDGRFFPQPDLTSIIEWTHRVVSAFVGLFVLALAVWAWIEAGRSSHVRVLAGIGLGFLVVESAVGAAAVLSAEPVWVIAIHLGIALTSFGATVSLTAVLWRLSSGGAQAPAGTVTPELRRLIWLTMVFVYAIVYWGALVAQTKSGPACGSWPLCQGGLVPSHWTGPVAIDYVHRLLALAAGGVFFALMRATRPLKESMRFMYRLSHVALGLVVLLMATGAYLVFSNIALVGTLVHVGLVSLLFATVGYMAVSTLPDRTRTPRQVAS